MVKDRGMGKVRVIKDMVIKVMASVMVMAMDRVMVMVMVIKVRAIMTP